MTQSNNAYTILPSNDGDNGLAVAYRFAEWGIGGFDIPAGKCYVLQRSSGSKKFLTKKLEAALAN